ncbi:hypothetical protein PAPYR_8674 [Paratrimastix pyriformis]|uniref:Uncharacterized protein n=1 Tax=Paratrimastix pyriformis TaxID=342808 RepID=A0ABQ8UH57_9EUKA|nr:hypothetical protein PAPYR_8674 [Paratrimastix pyriformis]
MAQLREGFLAQLDGNEAKKRDLQDALLRLKSGNRQHILDLQVHVQQLELEKLDLHTRNLELQKVAMLRGQEHLFYQQSMTQMAHQILALHAQLRGRPDGLRSAPPSPTPPSNGPGGLLGGEATPFMGAFSSIRASKAPLPLGRLVSVTAPSSPVPLPAASPSESGSGSGLESVPGGPVLPPPRSSATTTAAAVAGGATPESSPPASANARHDEPAPSASAPPFPTERTTATAPATTPAPTDSPSAASEPGPAPLHAALHLPTVLASFEVGLPTRPAPGGAAVAHPTRAGPHHGPTLTAQRLGPRLPRAVEEASPTPPPRNRSSSVPQPSGLGPAAGVAPKRPTPPRVGGAPTAGTSAPGGPANPPLALRRSGLSVAATGSQAPGGMVAVGLGGAVLRVAGVGRQPAVGASGAASSGAPVPLGVRRVGTVLRGAPASSGHSGAASAAGAAAGEPNPASHPAPGNSAASGGGLSITAVGLRSAPSAAGEKMLPGSPAPEGPSHGHRPSAAVGSALGGAAQQQRPRNHLPLAGSKSTASSPSPSPSPVPESGRPTRPALPPLALGSLARHVGAEEQQQGVGLSGSHSARAPSAAHPHPPAPTSARSAHHLPPPSPRGGGVATSQHPPGVRSSIASAAASAGGGAGETHHLIHPHPHPGPSGSNSTVRAAGASSTVGAGLLSPRGGPRASVVPEGTSGAAAPGVLGGGVVTVIPVSSFPPSATGTGLHTRPSPSRSPAPPPSATPPSLGEAASGHGHPGAALAAHHLHPAMPPPSPRPCLPSSSTPAPPGGPAPALPPSPRHGGLFLPPPPIPAAALETPTLSPAHAASLSAGATPTSVPAAPATPTSNATSALEPRPGQQPSPTSLMGGAVAGTSRARSIAEQTARIQRQFHGCSPTTPVFSALTTCRSKSSENCSGPTGGAPAEPLRDPLPGSPSASGATATGLFRHRPVFLVPKGPTGPEAPAV